MSPNTVVVTGAAGFIGNAVARRLSADNTEVIALDDFSSGRAQEVAPGVPVVRCDLRDPDQLRSRLPAHVDAVVHCAAQSSGEVSFDDPWDDMTRHVHATMRLLEAVESRGVSRFIYTSSMAAYGTAVQLPVSEADALIPLSYYGAGKAATENYVRIRARGRFAYTTLRPFSVYGPGQDLANLRQGMISIYLAQLADTGSVVVKGSLDRFRDFVHIEDAVGAYVDVLQSRECEGETLNLCSGKPTTVREVLQALLDQADAGWDAVQEIAGTPGDQFGMFGDSSRLRELAGWSPAWDVQRGIADMWQRARRSERRSTP